MRILEHYWMSNEVRCYQKENGTVGSYMRDDIKNMMEKLIAGYYDCNDFSYDMPDLLLRLDDVELEKELDDIPEICANYDKYKTDEEDLLNDDELKNKIKEIYYKVFVIK